MSLYATVISGGAVLGQVVGGLLISADSSAPRGGRSSWSTSRSGWPCWPFGRLLPDGRDLSGRALDLPGLAVLTPAVLAFVLPLVLGQPLGWPAWGWALLAASVVGFALLSSVEQRVARRGGQPILPRALLGLPGVGAGIIGLFAAMVVFGGWLFGFALQLQDGLGDSALRAGLTFAPAAVAFALVSLNWQRLPARLHAGLAVTGFVLNGLGLLALGLLMHSRRDRRRVDLRGRGARGRRDGGGVRAADDASAFPGAGGDRGGRERPDRDGKPARDRGGGGDVRHAVPEPGRAPAACAPPARSPCPRRTPTSSRPSALAGLAWSARCSPWRTSARWRAGPRAWLCPSRLPRPARPPRPGGSRLPG